MFKFLASVFHARRYLLWFICLTGLLVLTLPPETFADPPVPPGAEPCIECHEQETDAWQNSPHARASSDDQMPGATCEDCHGQYVDDHPNADVMQLTVDSSICSQCHTSTFSQWEKSRHAEAGVQCIGCHLSHSQEFRLTDEALCGACHRDQLQDFSHSVHARGDVICTDCHLSSTEGQQLAQVGTGPLSATILAPNHDFTTVLASDCAGCHGPDLHQLLPNFEPVADARVVAIAGRVPALTAKLETTQQENESLQTLVPVSLGLGIGIGAMLGIVFTLMVGYVYQRRAQQ